MRIFRFFCVTFLVVVFSSTVAFGQSLSRRHSIEIEVECLEAAMAVIAGLNGYNLDSQAFFNEWHTWANFTRRVDDWAFRHVQEVLRSLGEVHSEWENAVELGAEISDLNTRFVVLSQEMERLSLMMAASDSLDVLIAINDRLTRVSRDRDGIIGRRNLLLSQAASPVIDIHLWQTAEDAPPPVPASFGERVSRSFLNSWGGTVRFGGNLLVFFARYGLSMVIWAAVGGVIALVALKKFGKRKQEVVQNENAE
ncbi:MAG: DUF4349 domain-containing protein [Defluviitaleaceae bacterium]|nr:DUF4349 domain-containing protein [Defluviitaleaceae bacterium]